MSAKLPWWGSEAGKRTWLPLHSSPLNRSALCVYQACDPSRTKTGDTTLFNTISLSMQQGRHFFCPHVLTFLTDPSHFSALTVVLGFSCYHSLSPWQACPSWTFALGQTKVPYFFILKEFHFMLFFLSIIWCCTRLFSLVAREAN